MNKAETDRLLEIARALNQDDFRNQDLTSGNSEKAILTELEFYLNSHLTEKKRKGRIIEHILDYSSGDFSRSLPISSQEDELDVISMGLNTLSEELRENTISIQSFNDVLDSIRSPFFIIDTTENCIIKFNNTALDFFNYTSSNKYKIPVKEILPPPFIKMLKSLRWVGENSKTKQFSIKNDRGQWIVSFNKLESRYFEKASVSVVINDITGEIERQRETNNLVVRAIVDTQEKERLRFAKDIHDSLGQQLSSINFLLESLAGEKTGAGKELAHLLSKSNEAVKEMLEEIRNICFNLMPKTLEHFGLVKAIFELCRKFESSGTLKFRIKMDKRMGEINKNLEIALFRIIQEFINNSIKHGHAGVIGINLKSKQNRYILVLEDDGKGFDYDRDKIYSGMGLKNIKSRVESYNGTIHIKSARNAGVKYDIKIPV